MSVMQPKVMEMETGKRKTRKMSWDYLMSQKKKFSVSRRKISVPTPPSQNLSQKKKSRNAAPELSHSRDYEAHVGKKKSLQLPVLAGIRSRVTLNCMEPEYTNDKGGTPRLWMDTMSEEVLSECKAAFSKFDKSRKGRVIWKDFAMLLRSLGFNPTEKELEDVMLDRISQSHSVGTEPIDFPEFITIMAKRFNLCSDMEVLESAFRAFDTNGDGLISVSEFKSYNERIGSLLSEEEVDELFNELDINGDGYVNYEEFIMAST